MVVAHKHPLYNNIPAGYGFSFLTEHMPQSPYGLGKGLVGNLFV